MDNTFILDLQKVNVPIKFRLASKIAKFFKANNKFLKFELKENMLGEYMLSIEQAINIYHLLSQAILLKIPGDVVELGCYDGTTSILLRKTLDQFKSNKMLHVYDSFEGLPQKTEKDGNTKFTQGSCKTTKEALINKFKKFNVELPIIHVGWFKDTLKKELPKKISFAHLDGDFYTSIKESLEKIYPRLSKGAIVIVDDYCDPKIHNANNILPGVKKACDEFFKNKKEKMNVLIAGVEAHGYFRKE